MVAQCWFGFRSKLSYFQTGYDDGLCSQLVQGLSLGSNIHSNGVFACVDGRIKAFVQPRVRGERLPCTFLGADAAGDQAHRLRSSLTVPLLLSRLILLAAGSIKARGAVLSSWSQGLLSRRWDARTSSWLWPWMHARSRLRPGRNVWPFLPSCRSRLMLSDSVLGNCKRRGARLEDWGDVHAAHDPHVSEPSGAHSMKIRQDRLEYNIRAEPSARFRSRLLGSRRRLPPPRNYAKEKFRVWDQTCLSYGPCQTPTLWFCVERHKDARNLG